MVSVRLKISVGLIPWTEVVWSMHAIDKNAFKFTEIAHSNFELILTI
jgi:hypothetical protein